MTINEVFKYERIIQNIIDNTKDVKALAKFRLLGMLKQFQPIIENFNKIRDEKIIQYANTPEGEETGIIEPIRENFENDEDYANAFEVFMTAKDNFTNDMNELANSEIDTEIKKISYKDVIDAGIPSVYLLNIYELIAE